MSDYIRSVRKGTIFFNAVMWIYQLAVSFLFLHYKIYIMLAVLIINFCLSNYNWYNIKKNKYVRVVKVTYFELIVFMGLGTASLGMSYGFYLYGISLITIFYYAKYMSMRIKIEQIDGKIIIPAVIISYTVSCVYAIKHGHIYETSKTMSDIFFAGNSFLVFAVLLIYMKTNLNLINGTENKLEEIAHFDKLTGLFNRHYLLTYMEELSVTGFQNYWLAIIDIDNFKNVNDTYGHNGGDYILNTIAGITKSFFSDSIVCRWGGEEFIILSSEDKAPDSLLEDLRQKIADTVSDFEGHKISVTVTIGTGKYSEDYTIDKWISEADARLYQGKNSGKNKVVYGE